jgi:hypothetical protein
MTLQNDDLLLVNRGGQSFKTEYGVLKENINEDQGVTISENAPADPHEGDLWYNSEDGRLYVWYVNETTGIVTSVSIRNGGSGYTSQETNVGTAGGEGFGLTVDIDPGVGGNLANPQVNNGGHGYKVGDYIIVIGAGHQNGTLNVTAINTASVGQWVDASPDGGEVGGGPDLWQRSGTTLSPVVAGDDVDLGTGDLSAAAGTFSGRVIANDYNTTNVNLSDNSGVGIRLSGSGVLNAQKPSTTLDQSNVGMVNVWRGNTPTFQVKLDGSVKIGGTLTSDSSADSPNITLNADGNLYAIGVHNSTNSTISANVGVFNTGQLRRITSSAKYKTDIEDITDEYADKALQLRPVWYRSLCEGDEGKSAYGFIAEEVAQVEPRLASYDAEGNPDGVNYAMLVVHLTDIAQRQQTRIETLEAKVQQLEGGN